MIEPWREAARECGWIIGPPALRSLTEGAAIFMAGFDHAQAWSCQELLQWALPRLGLAWPGFRRVHRQVCKRIGRRLAELHFADPAAYRSYLEANPAEWNVLDSYCRISISRFWRDRQVFDRLRDETVPVLAESVSREGRRELRAWSAGCASGEEPYSLMLLWRLGLARHYPGLSLTIIATDVDARLLDRARSGRYPGGCMRELSQDWRERGFERREREFVIRGELRQGIEFIEHDVRDEPPPGRFDLILCRNLAFTYFDNAGRRAALSRFVAALRPGGVLVIGRKETLPEDGGGLIATTTAGIYRLRAAAVDRPNGTMANGPQPAAISPSG